MRRRGAKRGKQRSAGVCTSNIATQQQGTALSADCCVSRSVTALKRRAQQRPRAGTTRRRATAPAQPRWTGDGAAMKQRTRSEAPLVM
jgi:hypothetical protein